ncbi:hypothetical protein FSB78_12140 [Sphingomonas ginsenosidivorax]|uniref:L,D-transpeptidase n=1 Tax=Sphingomonas ginsenosidivorax TaxID=862135 RepID=A0A5C6UFU0_9SPHN|nr:hypothetical protein [Sphingomonas ginsenosidivorax]TXC71617.1 hypothetical protein FSB78_12140 [Sphingomonas ginsenosidivorax]
MIQVFPALAAVALLVPTAAGARPAVQTAVPAEPAESVEAEVAPGPSEAAVRVVDWVAATGDNHALPYVIVDKTTASMLMFDGKGKPLGQVPVLIGIAVGDDATPGVGTKNLAEIGPAEKTTPSGRYLARFGRPIGKERILWVDYATSVAIHPIPPGASKKERRRQRMLSPSASDNRITFGCINVPIAAYGKTIRPLFQRKGGYVYILPDTKPLEEVFPRIRVQPYLHAGGGL